MKMEWKKSLKSWTLWASVLAGLVVLYVVFQKFLNQSDETGTENEDPNNLPTDNKGNMDIQENYGIIRSELLSAGYSENMAKIVTAQAMWETANFTSEVFQNNNNYFGMRQPKQRQTTSLGDVGGYASYNTPDDSIKDLIMWFDAKGDTQKDYDTPEIYVNYIKSKNYFSDTLSHYKAGVNACYKTLLTEIAAG